MKAKAVVFPQKNQVDVREVDCPDPGPGDVVVRVTHSWISPGTEGSYLRGERVAGDTAWRPGALSPFPIVAGYQKIGVVESVGKEVKGVEVGETVFGAISRVSGMFESFGGHMSPAVTAAEFVWRLPAGAEPLAFAGMVLTQVGYNCGTRAPVAAGDAAVVIGDGLVGQWAAQTLAWRGADVTMVGLLDDRLARFTAGRTINAGTADWAATVRDRWGRNVAVAVDAVGSREATEKLMRLMRSRGHIVSAGFCGTDDRVSLQDLRDNELSLNSVSGWTRERVDATRDRIAAGDLQTLPLITHHFPVEKAREAWDAIRDPSRKTLGVILDW